MWIGWLALSFIEYFELLAIWCGYIPNHYDDVIMGAMASLITSLTIVYSTVYSGADQSKHRSSASLAFVWGIHRGPMNSPHKWPVTRKMFPFDEVIKCRCLANKLIGMCILSSVCTQCCVIPPFAIQINQLTDPMPPYFECMHPSPFIIYRTQNKTVWC